MGKIIVLKLTAVLSKKIWGYEEWIASTHPDGRQDDFYAAVGGEYPLLVKIIQADDTLSVQVHPDDEAAKRLENDRGKTECWYVLDAKPGAKLVYGLNGTYSQDELRAAVQENRLEACLQQVEVHKGDFIFIPSGTVHAIGGGLRLLEVQQSCNITYRLYDWGRPRELHVDKGIQVIKHDGVRKVAPFPGEFACEYFTLQTVNVHGGYSMLAAAGASSAEDWQLVYCIEGTGTIKSACGGAPLSMKAEDIFAVAPGEKITVEGQVQLMKIRCGNHLTQEL